MRVRKVHDEDGLRFELLDDEERRSPSSRRKKRANCSALGSPA